MKYLILPILSALLLALITVPAYAAPFNAADNNPQVVAFYPEGPHGIVGENESHEGIDLVMQAGKSGNFQQWFYGTSSEDGLHGDHSVWKIEKGQTCPAGWDLVENANPDWGDYLVSGANYCVKTNDFHPSH